MRFCPFMSTAEEKVDCDENCMLYARNTDGSETCAINNGAEHSEATYKAVLRLFDKTK